MRESDLSAVFDCFAAITIEQAEERVAWLEDALARWRTVLIIKQLDARRPPDLSDIVPLDKPLIECTDEERKEEFTDRRRGPRNTLNRRKLIEYLGGQPEGASMEMISRACAISKSTVHAQLHQWAGKDYHRIEGKWYLADVLVGRIVAAVKHGEKPIMEVGTATDLTVHKIIELSAISPRLVMYGDKHIGAREPFEQPREGDEVHNGNGHA